MKIKRFFAPDIRQAIKQVREELGPEAVILSNRRVEGGIEIVSAIDYDEKLLDDFIPKEMSNRKNESVTPKPAAAPAAAVQEAMSSDDEVGTRTPKAGSVVWSQEPTLVEMRKELKTLRGLLESQLSGLAWSELKRRFPLHAEILQRLSLLGLSTSLCERVVSQLPQSGELEPMWRRALSDITAMIPISDEQVLTQGGIVAVVGPTGVGKTTTVAKLAARFALRHGARHLGLITVDNYRIGAHEQLRAYGRILDIPVRTATNAEELANLLTDMYDRRLVLIDTAGVGQRDVRLRQQLSLLTSANATIHTYLVMATTARLSTLEDIADAYSGAQLDGCILTKVDETTCLGSAISVAVERELPVAYMSDGQRVPEDLQPARAENLVERSVAIMKTHSQRLEGELLTFKAGRTVADARL